MGPSGLLAPAWLFSRQQEYTKCAGLSYLFSRGPPIVMIFQITGIEIAPNACEHPLARQIKQGRVL